MVKVNTNKRILIGKTTVVAIGGPLDYGVIGAESMEDGAQVPVHDGDLAWKPFHLQYFNYTSSGPFTAPANFQNSQIGTVTTPLQPNGTTVTLKVTGNTTLPPQSTYNGAVSVLVIPTSGSGSGGIKVRATYSYVDPVDTSLSGSADDDSEETPPPMLLGTYPEYYSFTAHMPKDLRIQTTYNDHHWLDNGKYHAERWDVMRLYDQNDEGIPGVWVQERFPTFTTDLSTWQAKVQETGPHPFLFNDDDTYWSSCRSYHHYNLDITYTCWGSLDAYDCISFSMAPTTLWLNPAVTNSDGTPQIDSMILRHQYWAATTSTVSGGITVAVYLNHLTPVKITREKVY